MLKVAALFIDLTEQHSKKMYTHKITKCYNHSRSAMYE